jgi:hypothetical protein
MERGVTKSKGLRGSDTAPPPQILFTILGTPTSWNPIKAIEQGMHEQNDRNYGIVGMRCAGCGFLELYAE